MERLERDQYDTTNTGSGTGYGHTGGDDPERRRAGGVATSGGDESGVAGQAADIAARAQEQAGELASSAREMAGEKASAIGSMAQEKADAGLDRAASGLERAATNMRDRAEGAGGLQEQVGTKVAGGLESAATYFKDHDSAELWSEVETFVKDHPLQAAAGALVAGWMLGRMMR